MGHLAGTCADILEHSIISLGFDLMASGWGWGVGVLDEIKAISAQLGLGLGLSLAKCDENYIFRSLFF